jgi:hypothetical protein
MALYPRRWIFSKSLSDFSSSYEAGNCYRLHAGSLLGLLFNPEDGDDIVL